MLEARRSTAEYLERVGSDHRACARLHEDERGQSRLKKPVAEAKYALENQ